MPAPRLRAAAALPDEVAQRLQALRDQLQVPGAFDATVVAAAEQAITAPRLPDLDRTDLELITIDPPGSRDLDQAVAISAEGDGFVIDYAIADVGAFVDPGDPLDVESHRRGVTFYGPDRKDPVYPPVMSDGGASLLPDQIRPALLWTLRVDARGALTSSEVVRARVRSRAQLTYEQAQQSIDGAGQDVDAAGQVELPAARETLRLLALVGPLREQQERDRGGVSLNLPEQQVTPTDDGWQLSFRAPLPVEGWNAQISLLTGMAAAQIQLDGKVGLLRTLPPADEGAVRKLRRTAKALKIDWPNDRDYPDFVRSLDPGRPADAAMLTACTSLFRGAGYQAFNGAVPDPGRPEQTRHAALATAYAHATAPLRRLADRYTGEICVALRAGQPVPRWVLDALDALPEEMQQAERSEKKFERAVLDLAEVVVLADRVGEDFPADVLVVEESGRRGVVLITDPAVEAKITGADLPLGRQVTARLTSADLAQGGVVFEQV